VKNKISILIFILSFCHIAKAQNLVSNGYFEVHNDCQNDNINNAVGWNTSTNETPDYFNNCLLNGANVPNTFVGYQQDCFGGKGYAGGFMLNKNSDSARDYIYTKLIDTLKIGHRYIASLYVNRAQAVDYAVATIGILFTDTATVVTNSQSSFISANPQIQNNLVLSDTLNWILIQDTFIAVGGEVYLTIGNFNTAETSDSIKLTNYWPTFPIAYYYIDGVSVYDVTGGACNTYWDAGLDEYIHAGDSIRLGAINTDNSTYTWQNSVGGTTYLNSNTDARPWSKPSQTTTYYVTKTCPNNTVFKDTVTVYIQSTVGIKKFEDNASINIYPNPNNGNMSVGYNMKEDAILEITDITGNIVGTYDMPLVKTQLQIKNGELPSGIYFYRIMCKDTVVKLGKIVIIK
jgi:hypothetical protein